MKIRKASALWVCAIQGGNFGQEDRVSAKLRGSSSPGQLQPPPKASCLREGSKVQGLCVSTKNAQQGIMYEVPLQRRYKLEYKGENLRKISDKRIPNREKQAKSLAGEQRQAPIREFSLFH